MTTRYNMDDIPIHPPLRRVSHGPKVPVCPADQPQMLFATNEGFSIYVAETQDSCYSSCSEESYNSLSRKTSENSNNDQQQNNNNFYDATYSHLVEFSTKLGYSEAQLRLVIEKLGGGGNIGQDRVLAELIKLGRDLSLNRSVQQQSSSTGSISRQLRSIVIDGSNLAMTHGRKEIFSCAGIRECVEFFRQHGHCDIKVFVPSHRKESPRADCPITDQHILFELESDAILVWTPSRRINGRRVICHDDRYILKTAADKDAVIVSNDEYRDLVKENLTFRRLIDERLLMYSFVDGKFMPPDDPLGRHGPKLDQFLSKGGVVSTALICPYGRMCTYGNKCKYFHPERPNGVHLSVTQRLMKEKPNKKPPLPTHPSLDCSFAHTSVCRTRSLNVPVSVNVEPSTRFPSLNLSDAPLLSVPASIWHHQSLNRNLSAPSQPQTKISQTPWTQLRKNSSSETNLKWANDRTVIHADSADSALGSEGHFFVPSTAVWGNSPFSVGPISPPSHTALGSLSPSDSSVESDNEDRLRLQYHLCQLFPESAVTAVLNAHPEESNPQMLCTLILAVVKQFSNALT